MLAVWAVSLWLIARTFGPDRTLALAALVALSPVTWLGAANGSDFFTFGIAIAALVAWAAHPAKTPRERAMFAVVATLALQFRPPTLLISGLLRRQVGKAQALGIGLAGIGLQYAFLLMNPNAYVMSGPFWTLHKALRQSLLPDRPLLLSTLITVALIASLFAFFWLGKYLNPLTGTLGFLFVLLGTMAALNLLHLWQWDRANGGGLLDSLGSWEGGIWLSACLPLAALAVVLKQVPEAVSLVMTDTA
jgi:hypothetical protein